MESRKAKTSPAPQQLFFRASLAVRRPAPPSFVERRSGYFTSRTAFFVAGFSLLFGLVTFGIACWTRPFIATKHLLVHDNAFTDAAEAAEFAASVVSAESLEHM